MNPISQNKKIAISAIGVFVVSFMAMLFFLSNSSSDGGNLKTNVLHANKDEAHDLNEPEAAYREYIDDSRAPIVVTNPEGEVLYASEAFCSLISADDDVIVGTLIFDYINTKDLAELFTSHTKLLQGGERIEGIGPLRMLKGEEEVLVLLSAYPIMNKDNMVVKIIFSARDLTEQVHEFNGDTSEKVKVKDKEENKEENSSDQKGNWIKYLYPKINELENTKELDDPELIVDKISFKAQ